jgi:glycerate dehydrogenase
MKGYVDMKIVVLDGYSLNPGDLSWEELKTLENCIVYDRTAEDAVVERVAEAEIILTNKTVLTRQMIEKLPKLKYVGVLATGFNVVDLKATLERGILVTNVPGYSTSSVAQMVFALLLELTRQVAHHSRSVREGFWTRCQDFCYWEKPQIEMNGLAMGIVGFGQVGRAVAKLASAFGMQVLVNTRHPDPCAAAEVEFLDLDTLFRRSDVVSLHCPLTPETKGLVNKERLAMMKPTSYLINTARGALVEEEALAEALNEERIGGTGLDVLSEEPPPAANPLFCAKNCFITPHIAWATRAARERLMSIAVANVRAFLAGRPQNVVNR